jgi:hypothetical protein
MSDTEVTLEKSRIDKNRREEGKPHSRLGYLLDIPTDDLKELCEKYEASVSQVKRKAEQFHNYCVSKPKKYANYRAALENALDKDFGRRVKLQPKAEEPKRPLTADERAALDRISAEMRVTHDT